MPIYEYRCECGKKMEVLVRGGAAPTTCNDAMEAADWCQRGGKLNRLVSAPNITSGGPAMFDLSTGKPVDSTAECGHCGQTPGSCQDN